MRIVSPRCAHCGSPLELLADNFRLHCPHCKSCHLLVEEPAVKKPDRVQEVPRQTEWTEFDQKYFELRRQIDAVDQNGYRERSVYIRRDRKWNQEYPHESEILPDSLLMGLLWALYGLCAMLLFFVPFWAVLVTFAGLGAFHIQLRTMSENAENYIYAFRRYRQQRSILLLKIELLRISPRKAA